METLHQADVGAYYFDQARTQILVYDEEEKAWPLIREHKDGSLYLQITASRSGIRHSTLTRIGKRVLKRIQVAGVEIDRFSPIRYGYRK